MKINYLVGILASLHLSAWALANERIDPGHPPENNTDDATTDSQPQFQDAEQQAQYLKQQADQNARAIGNSWQSEGNNDSFGGSEE